LRESFQVLNINTTMWKI